jgi:hypothetical protein
MTDYFEAKFARLEYVGDGEFNVAYMQHTEKWWEIFQSFTLDQCLEAIKTSQTCNHDKGHLLNNRLFEGDPDARPIQKPKRKDLLPAPGQDQDWRPSVLFLDESRR